MCLAFWCVRGFFFKFLFVWNEKHVVQYISLKYFLVVFRDVANVLDQEHLKLCCPLFSISMCRSCLHEFALCLPYSFNQPTVNSRLILRAWILVCAVITMSNMWTMWTTAKNNLTWLSIFKSLEQHSADSKFKTFKLQSPWKTKWKTHYDALKLL